MEFKQINGGKYLANICEILLNSAMLTGSHVKGTLKSKNRWVIIRRTAHAQKNVKLFIVRTSLFLVCFFFLFEVFNIWQSRNNKQ